MTANHDARAIAEQIVGLCNVCPDCERTDCYMANFEATEAIITAALSAARTAGFEEGRKQGQVDVLEQREALKGDAAASMAGAQSAVELILRWQELLVGPLVKLTARRKQ